MVLPSQSPCVAGKAATISLGWRRQGGFFNIPNTHYRSRYSHSERDRHLCRVVVFLMHALTVS